MAINKIPKNYYSDTNIRRDKINEIIDEVNDIASIPSPSAADAGKVVKVSDEGEYELADDAGTVLPTPTIADSGKVIKVSDEGSYELADDEGTVLPVPTAADAGKFLGVDNNGAWELINISEKLFVIRVTFEDLQYSLTDYQNNDECISEISNAINSGKIPILVQSSTSYTRVFFPGLLINPFKFTCYDIEASSLQLLNLTINSSSSSNVLSHSTNVINYTS